jgi:hypothetical protein
VYLLIGIIFSVLICSLILASAVTVSIQTVYITIAKTYHNNIKKSIFVFENKNSIFDKNNVQIFAAEKYGVLIENDASN